MNQSGSPFSIAATLKEVPYPPDGSFAWLRELPTHEEWALGDRNGDALPAQMESILASASDVSLTLPEIFTTFMGDPSLHKRLRSANGDYLNLAESVLPFADGYLIRFLHDQQEGVFWYIYVAGDGSDHCVVSSYEYFDADEMDYELDELKESDFGYWAPSFEHFFCAYWIAHEMMFSRFDETPPPDVDVKFHKLYAE